MDADTIQSLLQVKITASAALDKIDGINDIQQNWAAEDEEIATKSTQVKLSCEYATFQLQATKDLCEQIIQLPPPYGMHGLDEGRVQFYEVLIRMNRVSRLIDNVEVALVDLVDLLDQCEEGMAEIEEVQQRVKDVRDDVRSIQPIISRMIDIL